MWSRSAAVLLLALAASCGFHLRGVAEVPFATVYLPGAKSGIQLDLKRNIAVVSLGLCHSKVRKFAHPPQPLADYL